MNIRSEPYGVYAETQARQDLMRICAAASEAELEEALAACDGMPQAEDIRPAEVGLVMLRGRMGGNGAAFNVGEATVTRAAVRLADGATGFSYLLGRHPRRARLAAIVDALGQDAVWREKLDTALVAPVNVRLAEAANTRAEETAATRVNFFTVVRGED
jgi:alpha-D-ribose 1-methylphosphonate 5-triphosphate synthase subunit PhnG